MKVLMLSTDMKILEEGSSAHARMSAYGELFEKLTILVLGVGERQTVDISENVHVLFPGGSSKQEAFKNALWEGMREGRDLPATLVSTQDPFFVGFVGWRIAHALHIPLQVQIHTDFMNGAYAFASPRKFLEVALAFFIIVQATCIRTVSKRVARSVKVFRKKTTVLPIRVKENIPKTGISPFTHAPAVLMVCRLETEKRVHLAIEALAHTDNAHLYIVGDGSLRQKLERLAQRIKVGDRVHFLGWQDNLETFYSHADVFLHLSRFEGYGLSLIEAGLAGLPIVSTDVGIVGEVYKPKEDVVLVNSSVSSITQAITGLLQNKKERVRLGQSAQVKARSQIISEGRYQSLYLAACEECT